MRALFGWLLAAALMLASGAASAHPHVWVDVMSELLYAEDGSVIGVRHAWTFDAAFSANALQGLQKTDGTYSREELTSLARSQVESFKEKTYFTSVTADVKQAFAEPTDCLFEHADNRLTLHFTLPLKAPVKAKHVRLAIYDRSFFIDFRLAKEYPLKLVGAPAGCEIWLGHSWQARSIGNDRDRELVQEASEDTFREGGANATVGLLFLVPISVECP
ncbi:ABC-type uncharacterized transport system, substrate-binding protein [Bradyrhizobium sp. Ghvi]|uniref:DUF1007 family protein n=1 Tax=Bradyrhizobium sp. Ghvi TaxID=1855319 RepID=UPI0008E60162|nr:DUF1007 family protein [Bradyrhizobium sp. Ghvi]SFN69925.1 ABC-type uncharacterized transport system, substrate-binding protein [Bradyrhizobium sp. Ghvi]